MQIPEIIYNGKGKDRRIVITDDLKVYLLNCKDSKVKISKALGVSRPTLDALYERCGVGKRETKKQRAVRKTAEQIVNAIEREEAKDLKQKNKEKVRKVKMVARQMVKENKSILDRMAESVKGKDGMPINYNGEQLTTEAMIDISLINQAKESPQANIYLRAQILALKEKEREEQMRKQGKQMVTKLRTQLRTRKQRMKESLESYGLWTGMMETTLDQWGDAYLAKELAKFQWEEMGGQTVEVQVTAQAQLNGRPNQYFETYQRALKVFNECDQKLSTALSKYQRITGRSEDDNSFLAEMMKGLSAIE